jgi:ATP-binding cassette subfamily B (MDR/TAP) protein 1
VKTITIHDIVTSKIIMAEEKGELPGSLPPSSPPEHEKNDKQSEASPESSPVTEEEKKKNARPERTATFQDYLRIFSYATKWDFLAYAAGIVAAIGAGVTMPLMTVLFGKFVGNISNFMSDEASREGFRDQLQELSLYMFGLFLARWGLGSINKFAFRMIGIRLSSAIRLHYLKRLFNQSIHVLDSMPPGHAVSTITATSNVLQLGISEKLGVFVEFTSLIVAAIIVSFTWNWELSLVTFSGVVFIMLIVSIFLPIVMQGTAKTSKVG